MILNFFNVFFNLIPAYNQKIKAIDFPSNIKKNIIINKFLFFKFYL